RVLRNDFGRSQSQSKEDPDLATADPQFHFNNESWIFPTTEGQYREGIEALKRYLVRLENGDARFFVRNDNLRSLLELVAKRLGDLAHRLSASVGIEDLDTYAIWVTKPERVERVVLIDFPSPEMKTIGLVTRTINDKASGEDLAVVYVPTSPNPTSGFIQIMSLTKVISTNWTLDEAMQFLLTAGTRAPDTITFARNVDAREKPPPAPE
ncbi:MAG: DUF2333 family protein, partial [Gammaproteobacteria bacterium]